MLIGSKPIGTVAIMAGVPATLTSFTKALVRMMIFSQEACCQPREYIHFDDVGYSDHGPARNTLVDRMLGNWLLLLDTDHAPPPDLLFRMLDRANRLDLDVLTGLYRFKTPPCSPVLYKREPETGHMLPIATYPPDAIFEIDAAGAGCLWTRKSVFEKIQQTGEGPFDRLPGMSEDHSFFRRLEKLGVKAYCDARIECPHLRIEPVLAEDQDTGDLTVGKQFAVAGAR